MGAKIKPDTDKRWANNWVGVRMKHKRTATSTDGLMAELVMRSEETMQPQFSMGLIPSSPRALTSALRGGPSRRGQLPTGPVQSLLSFPETHTQF